MRKYYALLGVLFLATLLRLMFGGVPAPATTSDEERPAIIVRGH